MARAGAMRGRWRGMLAAVATLAAASIAVSAAQSMRVLPLAREGQVLVSFDLADGFTAEIRDAVQSGLTTMFIYEVELRRAAALWVDRTLDSATVTASVKYDTLTRRYQLTRRVDGRVTDSRTAEDEEAVRRWLTSFERLPLFSTTPLEANADYYLRVRLRTKPRDGLFFFPWDRVAASAMAKFTFLP